MKGNKQPIAVTKVANSNRIMIVKKVAEILKINEGDFIGFYIDERTGRIYIEPVVFKPRDEKVGE